MKWKFYFQIRCLSGNFFPFFFFALAQLLNGSDCFSQWSIYPAINTPVCSSLNNQIDLRMTEDGKGGAFITWKDYSAGAPDIYIQRINAAGYNLWTANGVAICTNFSDQSTPALVSDMKGGVIVSWSDWRSGIERDIYAQRIGSSGNVLWAMDGIVVTNKNVREHNEKIVSDGKGGAIIVWEQQVAGQWDIWAQRIDSNGAALWASGGVPLCTLNAPRLNQKVQKDGRGGAIVTWEDFRNGLDYDIYAQLIDSAGLIQWSPGAKAICQAAGAQTNPKIDPDSSTRGAYIAWVDKRNGTDYDIYAQRVDSAGNTLWASGGVAVCAAPGNQSAVDVLTKTTAGAVVFTWKDNRNFNNDIFAQMLNASGNPVWSVNGNSVCSAPFDQINPNIVSDDAGGGIIVWQDFRNGEWDIYSQRINGSGMPVWPLDGVPVSLGGNIQGSPKNVSDGAGGSIYAWQDFRSGFDFDIYVHHLFWNGTSDGITESTPEKEINFYPNPFIDSGTLTFPGKENSGSEILIYNIHGQLLRTFFTNLNAVQVERGNFNPGFYYFRIIRSTGQVLTGKFCIAG